MDFDLLKRIIEAAILAAPQPLTVAQITDLFGEGEAPPADDIRRALLSLQEDSATRGVELLEVASGFRYQVRADVYPHISRLWAEKPARYSRALLETLALIAYRQPITRGEIEAIRGVAVNSQIVRTLEEREWIRVIGHRDVPGKPALFGTTRAFLDYFNLKSLDQLPALSALQELPDIEPELDFDGARATVSLPPSAAAESIEPGAADESKAPDAALQNLGTQTGGSIALSSDAEAALHGASEGSATTLDSVTPERATDDAISNTGHTAGMPETIVQTVETAPLENVAEPNELTAPGPAASVLDSTTRGDEPHPLTDTPDTPDPTGESETSPEQIP